MEVTNFFPIIIGAIITLVIIIALFAMIKTANGNEALVVSGVGATDKEGNPTIKRAGGRVVIPFIQKAKYFDLCVRTAKVEGDVTKTQTGVPIQIDWLWLIAPILHLMQVSSVQFVIFSIRTTTSLSVLFSMLFPVVFALLLQK